MASALSSAERALRVLLNAEAGGFRLRGNDGLLGGSRLRGNDGRRDDLGKEADCPVGCAAGGACPRPTLAPEQGRRGADGGSAGTARTFWLPTDLAKRV